MSVSVDPNFKSTLPPRKRAKTQEEKEQRRMERILRNRRAAHASREKKRRHVERLEAYVLALEKNNSILQSNVSKLSVGASETLLNTLEQPQDTTELKACISSTCVVSATSLASSDGDISTYEDSEQTAVKMEPLSPMLVAEKNPSLAVDEELNADASNSFYNYLSPVSLDSPIDLSLKQEPNSSLASSPQSINYASLDLQDGIVSLPTSRLDYLAQNSEVILFPRALLA
ncbi:hypothetical protein PUMCH_003781 [Australozyma saopauloensis]|uniref:BZIP domain-containing protein n=1 Tax=Australozyma saopauloensis TaxID=291208 RepID=A0AAX4HEX1_9ASCO|nr:hypothetical protein PUMCH_003781 [[Candida] saopauloensis]